MPLLNGEEPEEYDQEWRNASRRFPNQDDQEFQKARIEAARHRDACHLGAYFEGVKRLRSDYVPDIEIMHEEYDYNE